MKFSELQIESKRDPVKKNMDKLTKPATHKDKKKELKKGKKRKYKDDEDY